MRRLEECTGLRRGVRRQRLLASAVSLVLWLTAPNATAGEDAATLAALDRIRTAVTAHPDDPDLLWAFAKKLAASGAASEALAQTRRFLGRWPDRRTDARTEIARLLLEREAGTEALALLDEALREEPRSGLARFYRGLALRIGGDVTGANREFRIAAELSPALRPEALLARALGLFDLGREDEAVTLLQEIVRFDPTSQAAVRARLLLRRREALELERSWRVDAYAGFEWDDNVTLENSENEIAASGSDDFRGIWGVGATGRVLTGDKHSLTVGYRFDQTDHVDLNRFNLISNTGFASGLWQPAPDVVLRLDLLASNLLLDTSNEYTGGAVQPSVIKSFGPKWGALRVFTRFEIAEYHEDAFSYLERDALVYGAGFEHFLPLRIERSWISISGSWARTTTQEETDGTPEGLDGDFDYDGWRIRASSQIELPCAIRTRIDLGYTHDRYQNNNSTYYLSLGTLGQLRKRRDDLLTGRVAFSREVHPHVRIEAYWRGARRVSNVDLFDYDKQVVGLLVRVATD